MIVEGADIFIFQEREQFIFMALQSLKESFDIFVFMILVQELFKATVESSLTTIKGFQFGRIFSVNESDGISEQALQLFAKGLPLRGSVFFVHLGKVGKKMIETPLLCQGGDLVVGAPEVADQDSAEYAAQHFTDDRGAPALGDQIVAKGFAGEAPKPMGYTIESPAGFIGAQYPALGDPFSDLPIGGFQEMTMLLTLTPTR